MSGAPSLGALTRESFRVGCLGFGGPAGQIALMHRIFVAERQWIDEEAYQHSLNYCTLLPGPEAQQLATYLGWRWHGVRGGVIAGSLFVLPGAFVIFALAWLYAALGETPALEAIFFGVKAAVVAIIFEAVFKIARRALKTKLSFAIAISSFLALFLFNVPFPIIILSAAIIGLGFQGRTERRHEALASPSLDKSKTLMAAILWSTAWLAPLGISAMLLGPDHVLTRVGALFSQLAVVTFGGAYAMLAYLQQVAVNDQQWLTQAQMIDGFGLAETTPGPLVLVNQFVGFLAGWQAPGGGLGLAAATAAMASWCTFAPSFVWIFAGAPYAEQLRNNVKARAALAAITAAVLGIILKLAVAFSIAVLFRDAIDVTLPWGHNLRLPLPASVDIAALMIAALSALALIRFKVNVLGVVIGAALAGYGAAFVNLPFP
jgi:chromate transporter